MLSATPLQNRARELAAQLALFLGEVAYLLPPDELARHVVRSAGSDALPSAARCSSALAPHRCGRRGRAARDPRPSTASARRRTPATVACCCSSRSCERGHRAGRHSRPRCDDGSTCSPPWSSAIRRGDVRRGASCAAGVAAATSSSASRRCSPRRQSTRATHATLGIAIERERDGLDALLRTIARAEDPDPMRVAALLRAAARARPCASILAFSESASTVRAYWSAMRGETGVGLLTASEARIASGRVTRDELLARFAPRAQGARLTRRARARDAAARDRSPVRGGEPAGRVGGRASRPPVEPRPPRAATGAHPSPGRSARGGELPPVAAGARVAAAARGSAAPRQARASRIDDRTRRGRSACAGRAAPHIPARIRRWSGARAGGTLALGRGDARRDRTTTRAVAIDCRFRR